MDTTKQDRIAALDEELRSIKKSFEVLLLAIEAEGVAAAAEVADRLMARIVTVMNDIKTVYVEDVFEGRLRTLTEDRQRLADARASGRPSTDAFIELVGRIERHISNADREFRILVPSRPAAVKVLSAHWKKAAAVLGAVVLAVGLGSVLRDVMTHGKGLKGEYYEGEFRKLVKTRRDLQIDFALSRRGPIRGLGADNYSVRWTGSLRAPSDGDYEFVTRSDDGVRLFIDDEAVIQNWSVHRAAMDKATKTLTAGQHRIRLEWFQRRGPATMRLFWRTANDAQPRLIDADYLSPS